MLNIDWTPLSEGKEVKRRMVTDRWPWDVSDPRHGIHHSRPIVLVVEVELVDRRKWIRVADEADARVVLSNVQLADDVVDEREYRLIIGARRIAAADRLRVVDHEDDVCPRELARYGS